MKRITTFFGLAMILAMIAPGGHAATTDRILLGVDPIHDQELFEDLFPPFADLTGMYIQESETALTFTWEVIDIPSDTGVPEASHFYWDFTLDDPDGVADPVPFELYARAPTVEGTRGGARLEANCTNTANVIDCEPTPAVVTLEISADDNTISATVLRADIKDADGNVLAVDGAVFGWIDIFDGITSCVSVGVISTLTCDPGTLTETEDGTYTLGG